MISQRKVFSSLESLDAFLFLVTVDPTDLGLLLT